MQKIIEIVNGVARHPKYRLAAPVSLVLNKGEHWAIYGENGSGKTLLVDMLRGAHPLLNNEVHYDFGDRADAYVSDDLQYLAFKNADSVSGYYQQRYNHGDAPEYPTVGSVLSASFAEGHANMSFLKKWGLSAIWDKEIPCLSSGESRKFALSKVLLKNPSVLILDQPFIGLDSSSREELTAFLSSLAQEMTIVLVVNRQSEIPAFVTHVVHVRNGMVSEKQSRGILDNQSLAEPVTGISRANNIEEDLTGPALIEMRQVRVECFGKVLLQQLDWTVKSGESWALTGENGAGKSTLLSLVFGDHPAAYANNVSLFGKRRGKGDNIWDIKRRIGYVSPELIASYAKPLTALEIVCSGCRDTVGLYGRMSEEEQRKSLKWMEAFGALSLKDRDFLSLSSGEQRWVMLIRAFVKSPELLVLDEPFQGLDETHCQQARDIIDRYMEDRNHTLIMVTHHPLELPRCINRHLHLQKAKS